MSDLKNERKGLFSYLKGYNLSDYLRIPWYFFWGHILGTVFYKKKYYYGKCFQGHFHGIAAPGWRWICYDATHRTPLTDRVPWPCSPYISIVGAENIHFHPDDLNNFQGQGKYYQAINDGSIYIGKGSWIADGVGIITSNHDVFDPDNRQPPRDVIIGEQCWIGMNSVILPGVELGAHTIVGAGSIVTKSFKHGNCIIAGNPAKVIKIIEIDKKNEDQL